MSEPASRNASGEVPTVPLRTQDLPALWATTISADATITASLRGGQRRERPPSGLVVQPMRLAPDGACLHPPPHYAFIDLLGQGGMGVVYTARQTCLNRTIALKMIREMGAGDEEQRARFLSEAAVTGELEHPNIVPIYDLGANERGELFYAMKKVEGTPWDRVLGGKRLAENLDILLRVADAVAFAHSKGVIHRDLKPENVMLGGYGEVLVMDWGLAAAVAGGGKAEPLAGAPLGGTAAYMAPEMAQGDPAAIGFHSDVYLLGAILYEIVTGLRPHTGDGVMNCLHQAARNLIQPTTVQGELVEVARKAMATVPAQRYATVKDFQQAIRDYTSHAESIALAATASAVLAQAAGSRDYGDFTRALFTYEQALTLWPGNAAAQAGLGAVRLAHATCACERGDLDLAESLLTADLGGSAPIRGRIAAARQERRANERRRAELERERAEGWIPVCDLDFTSATELDPRLEMQWCSRSSLAGPERQLVSMPAYLFLTPEGLGMTGMPYGVNGLTMVHWLESVADDVHLEISFNADAPSMGAAVAGNGVTGYRVTLDTESRRLVLDTFVGSGGGSRLLAVAHDLVLEPDRSERLLSLERNGQFVRAWVDGVLHLEWFDPLPLFGEEHRCFAVTSASEAGAVLPAVRRLRVSRRRTPEVVPVLEVGRHLLRLALHDQAARFFTEQMDVHAGTPVALEAAFLLAVVRQAQGRLEEALALFEQAATQGLEDEVARQVRRQAFGQAVRIAAAQGDFPRAVELALRARPLDPHGLMPQEVFRCACTWLDERTEEDPEDAVRRRSLLSEERQAEVLATLSRLGLPSWDATGHLGTLRGLAGSALRRLQLDGSSIRDLSPLRGLALESLSLSPSQVSDLAPLSGMPLQELRLGSPAITDLSALRGMPLTRLAVPDCAVRDLAPLSALPLARLECDGNAIADLSPLAGLPLTHLECGSNAIAELSPLAGLPLTSLDAANNFVSELSPLADLPLASLNLRINRVADLAPLRHLPLAYLNLSYNQVEDLSPLEGKSFEHLMLDRNRIAELEPLASVRAKGLHLYGNRIADVSALAGVGCEKLVLWDNRISDLSPLAGLPLQELFVSGNPISDYTPLRGLALDALDAGAAPWTEANRDTFATLPLMYLAISSPLPEWLRFLADLASGEAGERLQFVNYHNRQHFLELAGDLVRIAEGGTAPLLRHAKAVGRRRLLAVPLPVTLAEAERWAAAQGGRLASPAGWGSRARFDREIMDYIVSVGGSGYHVQPEAFRPPPSRDTHRDRQLRAARGMSICVWRNRLIQEWINPEMRGCFLMEWPEG